MTIGTPPLRLESIEAAPGLKIEHYAWRASRAYKYNFEGLFSLYFSYDVLIGFEYAQQQGRLLVIRDMKGLKTKMKRHAEAIPSLPKDQGTTIRNASIEEFRSQLDVFLSILTETGLSPEESE